MIGMSVNLMKLNDISTKCHHRDWNGYGADPVPVSVIDVARKIVRTFGHIHQPEIFPIPGGLQLEWERGDKYLEIEIKDAKASSFKVFLTDRLGADYHLEGLVTNDPNAIRRLADKIMYGD